MKVRTQAAWLVARFGMATGSFRLRLLDVASPSAGGPAETVAGPERVAAFVK
jgi:hypothetical protein